jgi:hypothetical protein
MHSAFKNGNATDFSCGLMIDCVFGEQLLLQLTPHGTVPSLYLLQDGGGGDGGEGGDGGAHFPFRISAKLQEKHGSESFTRIELLIP